MIAVDTNLIVCLFVDDAPDQAQSAKTLISGQPIFISKTVLLETYWVLNKIYRHTKIQILQKLLSFLQYDSIVLEDETNTLRAFHLAMNDRLEFTEAMHIATAHHTSGFATFDKPLIHRAKGIKPKIDPPKNFHSIEAVRK